MAVRCPQHGLALAPDGRCVRCRKDEELLSLPAPPQRATARTWGIRLALALGAAVSITLIAIGIRGERAPAPSPKTGIAVQAHVEPAASAPELAPLASAKAQSVERATNASRRAGGGARAPLDRAMHDVPITLYGRPSDQDTGRARAWLQGRGYVYTERDVESDPDAARARAALTPTNAIPVIDVGGQAVVGFDGDRLTRALEYAAARRMQR